MEEKFIQIACMPQAPDNPIFALTNKGRIFMLKQEDDGNTQRWAVLVLPDQHGMNFEDVTVFHKN